ncbi:MAG: hypothetical protein OEZ13_09480 [Spirochaetia bacterium]|nr:hypothetical protein [Spirochaetia bacterium]
MDFYNISDYLSCSNELNKEAKIRNLTEIQNLIFGECLFQIKQYKKSAYYFNLILEKKSQNSLRAAGRLVDIYNLGAQNIEIDALMNYLLNNEEAVNLGRQIQKTLITRNQIDLFLPLYKKYPIQLSDQQFNTISAAVDSNTFENLIKDNPDYMQNYDFLWAKYQITHGESDLALQILDKILKKSFDREAVLLKASIYWNNQKTNEAVETLNILKRMGIFGYMSISDFYFENADLKRALLCVHEGIEKGYSLYDREILYEMSLQNFEKAAYLLEKYVDEKKISVYRRQSMMREYFSQGTKQDYWRGLKRYEKENPGICLKAVFEQMPWDTAENIQKEVKICRKNIKYEILEKILFHADSIKRYDVITLFLKNKKKISEIESYLLGKSLYFQEPENINLSLKKFENISFLSNFTYTNEVSYYKALIYLKTHKFSQAQVILKSLNYQDANLLFLACLFYQDKPDELEGALNGVYGVKAGVEKLYFQALWSMQKKQMKQSKELFESYLEKSGSFGNKAVYILFLLKYFSNSEELRQLCINLAKYPNGLSDKDWNFVKEDSAAEKLSELQAFSRYWYARYLILTKKDNKAYDMLRELKESENAALLQSEINYILLSQNEKNINNQNSIEYLIKFPASPFRVFIKP